MAILKFGRILSDSLKAGVLEADANINKSKRWYIEKTRDFRGAEKQITTLPRAESNKALRGEMIGKLYFFGYNPKTKDNLPYWDGFPLVLPIDLIRGGIRGLNFHYLPYRDRAMLMDRISDAVFEDFESEDNYGKKRNVSYGQLDSRIEYKYMIPTIKSYLFSHMTTRMVELNKAEWPIALFLPVSKFNKANSQKVWEDSRRKIREA